MFSFNSSRSLLSACRSPSSLLSRQSQPLNSTQLPLTFARFRSQLAPKRVDYIKRHKGIIPVPIGGSTKGTTLAFGEWGIRIKGNGVRLTAKQLTSAEDAIKRKIKTIKGAKVYMRVFPDIPVCQKGNETRMGKGKGAFEFWATRVSTGRVIFELGGVPIREELAREALRLAVVKLPTAMEFIDKAAPPRLGRLLLEPPKDTSAQVSAEAS